LRDGPSRAQQETDVTELNNEIHELTFDELEQVSGGRGVLDIIVDAYLAAVGKNLMDAIHPPAPKKTMTLHMR
jgi:bacteriocin-like protein